MAHMKFNKLLSLCTRRGFFLELPKGCSQQEGAYVYGPLGAELRRNIINEWWHAMVTSTSKIYGVSSNVFMPSSAKDPSEIESVEQAPANEASSKGNPTHEDSLLQMLQVAKTLNLEPPYGVAEIGKRCRGEAKSNKAPFLESLGPDSDHMGVNFLCPISEERQLFSQWQKKRLRWWRRLSRNPEKFSLGEGVREEGDSRQQCSIQYEFPWGSCDVENIRNRGDADLKLLAEKNTSLLKALGSSNEEAVSSLISMEAGVDRAVLTYLCDAYNELNRPHTTSESVLFKLHISLAPYKVAVLPTEDTNTKLCMYCKLLSEELKHAGIPTIYCDNGPLDSRLSLQDEVGTPYRVIADDGTLETGIVSLQDRDTTGEEDMNGRDVLPSIQRMLFGARIN